jgi:hypothetical protein
VLKGTRRYDEPNTMSQGTAFHDSSSGTTPSYDFVARTKHVMPPANPTFAGVPLSSDPSPVLAPGYVPVKPPGLSRAQKGLLAIPLVAALGVLASFGSKVGWGAYQDHRRAATVAATHIVLPDEAVGMTKRGGAAQAQADQLTSLITTPTPAQAAIYGGARTQVALVVAGTFAMSDQDQQDYLTGASDSAKAMGYTLTQVDPGRLGGQMVCGSRPKGSQTFCAFTDVAAYGVVVVPGQGRDGVNTAGAFRAAVERRS